MNLDEVEEVRRLAQVVVDEGKYFAGRSYVQDALGTIVSLIAEVRQLRFEAEKQTIIADILREELKCVLGTAAVFGPPGLDERLKKALKGESDD